MLLCKRIIASCSLYYNSRSMASTKEQLLELVKCSIDAVSPDKLIKNAVKRNGDQIIVGQREFTLNNNAYIIGFGKAVLGMVPPLEKLLGEHLQRGIISVPVGLVDNVKRLQKDHLIPKSNLIEIFEGAQNNMPGEASLVATKKICELVKNCANSDIIFALISGGGSALLTYPAEPLTIEDKSKIVQHFSRGGSTIQEINNIRSEISLVKGGKLASMAHPTQIVSLILSDIIGDPIELIASGPTVDRGGSNRIQYKDNWDADIVEMLKSVTPLPSQNQGCPNAHNVVIGSNKNAINAVIQRAKDLNFHLVVLANNVSGIAKELGATYAHILTTLLTKKKPIFNSKNEELFSIFEDRIKEINSHKKICIIASGEPTVNVTGIGVGGRNMELVMGFSVELYNQNFTKYGNWGFCSFGTDGQDGPTPAAGALITDNNNFVVNHDQLELANKYLGDNNSYNFFAHFFPQNLITTGLTCTNVMDLHILLLDIR